MLMEAKRSKTCKLSIKRKFENQKLLLSETAAVL